MIDLHSHILPEVDDGAKNTQEALFMLSDSFNQGVKLCVATPHCIVHEHEDITKFCRKRDKSFKMLKEQMTQNKFPEILLGAEVYLDNNISKHEDVNKLCIGQSNLILVEFPIFNQDKNLEEWVYLLTVKGYKPIIAHIERYPNAKQLISNLRDLNLIYQINASRLLSYGGRRTVKDLIETGERFVLSSDMHNTTSRKCNMGKACHIVSKKFKETKMIIPYKEKESHLSFNSLFILEEASL